MQDCLLQSNQILVTHQNIQGTVELSCSAIKLSFLPALIKYEAIIILQNDSVFAPARNGFWLILPKMREGYKTRFYLNLPDKL